MGQFENTYNYPAIYSEAFISSRDLFYEFHISDIITNWKVNFRSSQERKQH